MAAQQMTVTMTGFAASHPVRNSTNPELVSFRMASTPSWNRDGEWVDGSTLFINVQCWGKLAEHVLSCVMKGAPLIVAGRMTCYRYTPEEPRLNTKKEPVTEEIWRIRATNVGLDLSHSLSRWEKPAKPAADADSGDGGDAGDSSGVAAKTTGGNLGGFSGITGSPAAPSAPSSSSSEKAEPGPGPESGDSGDLVASGTGKTEPPF